MQKWNYKETETYRLRLQEMEGLRLECGKRRQEEEGKCWHVS